MTYSTIATIQEDFTLRRRLNACAAQEGIENPAAWVEAHAWEFATQPGWAAAWDSALVTFVENPGARETVISDAQILAAVQAVNN